MTTTEQKMRVPVLTAPGTFEHVEVPHPGAELRPGEVLVRVLAGGICGSDAPLFRSGRAWDGLSPSPPGSPLHEIVGEVVRAASDDLKPGDRVVGWATRFDGLDDYLVTEAGSLHAYQVDLPPEEAVVMQPLACVLYAVERIGSVAGLTCAVLGLGPIGLLFCHVLKQRGATRVTGVDRVDRTAIGPLFGIDEVIWATSANYAAQVGEHSRPDVIVEAVGHQVTTLQDAVSAVGEGGRIFYFGIPDDAIYPINMMRLLRSNLTLMSGATLERSRVLAEAEQYVQKFPEIVGALITHRFSRADVQRAFEVAVTADAARLKVVLRFDETGPS
jgi:threonine dehydrogenase-like Zn-dependent dehydrogenase